MLNLSLETESVIKKTSSIIFCLLLFIIASCKNSEIEIKANAQTSNTPFAQAGSTPEISNKDSLEQEADRLTKLYENRNCKEFFNAFPDTFEEFDRLYGFDDEKGGRILYSDYQNQVSYFFNCSEVSNLERLKKSIKIGVNGRWEADASALVQDSAFNLIKDYPNEAKEILDKLPDEKASSFWYFLFDGPHPKDKEIVKRVDLLSDLLDKKSKQSKLLLSQHQKLVVDWSKD